jgi:hypothetical protein
VPPWRIAGPLYFFTFKRLGTCRCRITLEWILKESFVTTWSVSFCSSWRPVAGFREHGGQHSGSTITGDFWTIWATLLCVTFDPGFDPRRRLYSSITHTFLFFHLNFLNRVGGGGEKGPSLPRTDTHDVGRSSCWCVFTRNGLRWQMLGSLSIVMQTLSGVLGFLNAHGWTDGRGYFNKRSAGFRQPGEPISGCHLAPPGQGYQQLRLDSLC